MVERCTVYEVAFATAFQVRLIAVVDTAVAARPVGVPSAAVAETCAESAEVPDEFTAATR